jgi:RNase adaptor protein for sRNA GlmZ degradation
MLITTGASSQTKIHDGSVLLRRRSSRRRHSLKMTTMNTEAIAEEKQLWLKVVSKIKHVTEPKRKD